jgi:hypothetical protein
MEQQKFKYGNETAGDKNAFVFVVCGQAEHINTLHFSLRYLKHFSRLPAIVVTDSKRNEIPVLHDNILDIVTPGEFDHHQASIWLKTSLHRLLPEGRLYCYLDSDVIAVNSRCDEIFSHYTAPITFAADHCRLNSFSPYALNCGCAEKHQKEKDAFENAMKAVIVHPHFPPDYRHIPTRELFSELADIRDYPLKNFWPIAKIATAFAAGNARVKRNLILDIKNKTWKRNGFLYPFLFARRKEIAAKTGYRYSLVKRTWLKPDGKPMTGLHCSHLAAAVGKLTGIRPEENWQHWNGGVFLFNKSSLEFMDKWHDYTRRIFNDTWWKTRDQGTLVATVWEMGLERHPVLPESFNMIADFYKPEIKVMENKNCLTILKGRHVIKPSLIHIYHEFGNDDWDLWRSVAKILSK